MTRSMRTTARTALGLLLAVALAAIAAVPVAAGGRFP